MWDKLNLEYLCTNLGNLSGIPVGLYEGKKLAFYYSIVSLPNNPFAPYIKEASSISDHIGYFGTSHGYYYGVVNFEGKRIIVGPTRQIPISEQELKEIAFEQNIQHGDVEEFVKGMKSIMAMPLQSILQMLCTVNHIVNEGETLTLSDISIADLEQRTLMETLETEAAERTIQNADGFGDKIYPHNSMDIEAFMLDAIRKGDVVGLKQFFASVPAIRGGIMAQEAIRQAKNTLIVSATLISRSAIYGGMDPEEALTLSDGYIQKCELMKNIESITNLNYRLVMDYAERMEQLHYGDHQSRMVIEVNNYIRHHLSEPITVEDLAKFLCKGRSRLSTDFKKETGENLSEYILKRKIEEGKKLLRYTDKPSVEIALYLGFSSQSHFSRTFKKYTDFTPNEYRHAKRNQ